VLLTIALCFSLSRRSGKVICAGRDGPLPPGVSLRPTLPIWSCLAPRCSCSIAFVCWSLTWAGQGTHTRPARFFALVPTDPVLPQRPVQLVNCRLCKRLGPAGVGTSLGRLFSLPLCPWPVPARPLSIRSHAGAGRGVLSRDAIHRRPACLCAPADFASCAGCPGDDEPDGRCSPRPAQGRADPRRPSLSACPWPHISPRLARPGSKGKEPLLCCGSRPFHRSRYMLGALRDCWSDLF
jgi:hypothetical protein